MKKRNIWVVGEYIYSTQDQRDGTWYMTLVLIRSVLLDEAEAECMTKKQENVLVQCIRRILRNPKGRYD